MERPTRFEHHRFLGDKRTQRVYDLDTFTDEDVIAHARKSQTHYKLPKHVYFRAELPKTNVGKILRRALRDELRAGAK